MNIEWRNLRIFISLVERLSRSEKRIEYNEAVFIQINVHTDGGTHEKQRR
jgi:hypothetical protein